MKIPNVCACLVVIIACGTKPGPAGPPGPAGAQGLQGTPGNNGAAGTSILWRGTWDSTTSYAAGDAVALDGSSYVALVASSNQSPDSSPLVWDTLARAGNTALSGHFGTASTPIGTTDQNVASYCIVGQLLLFPFRMTSASSMVEADGRLLSISEYPALFSLLAFAYGGNGTSSFSVPDMRAVTPNGMQYLICTQGLFP